MYEVNKQYHSKPSRVLANSFSAFYCHRCRGNQGDHLAMLQHQLRSRIFMTKYLFCIFGRISLVSCIISLWNERNHYWGSISNTIDEIEPNTYHTCWSFVSIAGTWPILAPLNIIWRHEKNMISNNLKGRNLNII